jgi:anhydro-N-acetylmuramic acid kinase
VIPSLQFEDSVENKLCTGVEFVAIELAKACTALNSVQKLTHRNIFVTGGGALNLYLISRLKYYSPDIDFILPPKQIIEFKEVSFIALAGLCRLLGIPNLYASVTGAPLDTVNGALYSKTVQSKVL